MEKITVDEGKAFDFGKTSKAYAKYRDIYPEEVFAKLHELGVGVQGRAADGWTWVQERV